MDLEFFPLCAYHTTGFDSVSALEIKEEKKEEVVKEEVVVVQEVTTAAVVNSTEEVTQGMSHDRLGQ